MNFEFKNLITNRKKLESSTLRTADEKKKTKLVGRNFAITMNGKQQSTRRVAGIQTLGEEES
jgi:hypothetical protein